MIIKAATMKNIFLLVFISMAWTSCTKDFEELRKNPNNVQGATPGSFLAPVLYEVTATNLNRAHRMGNDLMQYTVHKGDGIEFHRYFVTPTEADYFWDRHYRFAYNIQDMYKRAIEYNDKPYQAIALTLKAWVVSQLTDIFGDIPYSDALRGDSNLLPKYDQQQFIYTDLMKGLDSAAVLFPASGTLAYGTDLLYAGDISKWRKFCNSLRLRLYLRLSKRPEMNSAAKIKEIISNPSKYPVFTSNADQACLYYTGSEPFYNPFYNARDLDFGSGKAATTFILEMLQERNDPRLPVWYTKSSGDYIGIQSGYPRSRNGEIFATPSSAVQNTLKTSPLLGLIMSYAEVQFILAEARLKDWITTSTAQAYYEEGIKASMAHWGVTMPADYLTQLSVQFDNQLSTIMAQKYLAQWFVGLESWYEYRRTGYPQVPANPEALNDRRMPVRLLYPTSTQLLNRENYNAAIERMGGDDVNIKCWWEK
jgi:hypothetical protein